jgi:hypothetical protein
MINWIQVQIFILPQEAYMAKSYLESEGIEVFLRDEISSRMFNVNGGVKLLVPDGQMDKALELLRKGGFL